MTTVKKAALRQLCLKPKTLSAHSQSLIGLSSILNPAASEYVAGHPGGSPRLPTRGRPPPLSVCVRESEPASAVVFIVECRVQHTTMLYTAFTSLRSAYTFVDFSRSHFLSPLFSFSPDWDTELIYEPATKRPNT